VDKGYSEWYWKRSLDRGDAAHQFHIKNYGNNFKYEQFGPMLKAELAPATATTYSKFPPYSQTAFKNRASQEIFLEKSPGTW
jgi:hypothetical protein